MNVVRRIGLVVVLGGAIACGQSPEEKRAEALTEGAAEMQKSADPVDFRALQGAIPVVSGWERSKPTGERMTMPVRFVQATASFTKGDVRIEQKITDSAFNQLATAPFAMMVMSGYSKETSEGHEKSTGVAGFPAFEKWDIEDKRGELTVIVNKRFVVELEGSRLSSEKDLHDFIGHTNLKKLGELK